MLSFDAGIWYDLDWENNAEDIRNIDIYYYYYLMHISCVTTGECRVSRLAYCKVLIGSGSGRKRCLQNI